MFCSYSLAVSRFFHLLCSDKLCLGSCELYRDRSYVFPALFLPAKKIKTILCTGLIFAHNNITITMKLICGGFG